MIASQPLETVQHRLAQHYVTKLRQVGQALQRNRENSSHWFRVLEQDWAQIKHWQQWTADHSNDNVQSAELCVAFGTDGHEYLTIRQSTGERLIWYRQALAAAQQRSDDKRVWQLLYDVGAMAYQTGAFEEAEQCAKRLLEIGKTAKDRLSLGHGWFITGNLHSHHSELDAAEAAFNKALKNFERCHAEMMVGHALQGIARIMIFRGQYQEALIHAERYLSIIQTFGREADFSLAYHTLSNIHTRLGNLSDAKGYALKAVDNSRRLGFVRMLPSNLLILGYAELALNELDAAWDHFQETITGSRRNSAKFDLTAATYSLGDVRMRQKQYSEALSYYQEALNLANESRIAAYQSLCSLQMAYIYALRHEIDESRKVLQVGAEIALHMKSDILLAKALIPAVKLWQDMDESETAAEWSGLLSIRTEHAEPQLVQNICKVLEAEIGTEFYQQAAKRGQQLRLDAAVSNMLKMLVSKSS